MSIRASQHLGHEHSWQLDIRSVVCLPCDLCQVASPHHAFTNNFMAIHETPLLFSMVALCKKIVKNEDVGSKLMDTASMHNLSDEACLAHGNVRA